MNKINRSVASADFDRDAMSNARVSSVKMAENDIDLYAEDIDQDFAQVFFLPHYILSFVYN